MGARNARGAATLIVPTVASWASTGFPRYGLLRSRPVAVAIMVLTCAIIWVVAVFTLVTALSRSPAGIVVVIVLCVTPARLHGRH